MDKLISSIHTLYRDSANGDGGPQKEVSIDQAMILLSNYKPKPQHWLKYARFDPKEYTRNLVDSGNGRFNLLILCWGPGMCSSIHDHTSSLCFVKVLQGQLMETRYHWPSTSSSSTPSINSTNTDSPLVEHTRTVHTEGTVTYIDDSIGLHRMENPSHADPTVTLHLYTPPLQHCHSFDLRTGRRAPAQITYHTKYGKGINVAAAAAAAAAETTSGEEECLSLNIGPTSSEVVEGRHSSHA